MFTGIVKGPFKVASVQKKPGLTRYSVALTPELVERLEIGASISVSGVCQTVVEINKTDVSFDAIQETLERTTIQFIQEGTLVNIERSAKIGDEIGGHLVSGHVYGRVKIEFVQPSENNLIVGFRCDPQWARYLFSKGFIALDGASLTLVDVDSAGFFTVHLIPETIKISIIGQKKAGDWVNIEFDSQTQAIVETVSRVLERKGLHS